MLIYEKKIKTPWIIKKEITEEERERINLMATVEDVVDETESKPKSLKILKFKGFVRRDLEEDVIKDHKVLFH